MAKGLLVKFFIDAEHMTAESEVEGRPIFRDREYVEIIPIGDTKTVQCKPVTDAERQRYPEEYAVFKRGIEMVFSGTPLNQWPIMLPAQIKLFNHFNIYTVEQLSEIDDIAISRVGPGTRDFVEKAKAFLAKAKGSADVQRFASENLAMKEEIAAQGKMIADLVSQLKAMDAEPERRGPGRPRKEEQVAA